MEVLKKCTDMTLGDIMDCSEHSGGARLTAGLNLKGVNLTNLTNSMVLSFSEYFHEKWLDGLYKTYTNLYQSPLFHKTSYTLHLHCLSVLDQLLYVVHDSKSLYKW